MRQHLWRLRGGGLNSQPIEIDNKVHNLVSLKCLCRPYCRDVQVRSFRFFFRSFRIQDSVDTYSGTCKKTAWTQSLKGTDFIDISIFFVNFLVLIQLTCLYQKRELILWTHYQYFLLNYLVLTANPPKLNHWSRGYSVYTGTTVLRLHKGFFWIFLTWPQIKVLIH